MKKFFLTIFVLAFVGSGVVLAFSDTDGHSYEEAILYLKEKSVIEGYSDGTFKPNKTINRAEFVKILVGALLGEEPQQPTVNCFSDVPKNEWFAPYVCYAKNQNIIDGYEDGTFKPTQEINLVEAAKILVNSMGLVVDESEVSVWYRPFIESLQKNSYIPASFSSLEQKVKRGEMAEMIWRINEEVKDQPSKQFDFETDGSLSLAGNPNGFCAVPEDGLAEDSSNPDIVIGNGTAESCTSEALVDAVAKGGVINFNCGKDPVTIKMEETAKVYNNVGKEIVIEGGGLVTLDGQNERRIIYMNTCDQDLVWTTPHCNDQDHPKLTVQNLTFINGNSTGLSHQSGIWSHEGGGAIFARGGRLKVINSKFFDNVCDPTGPDVAGGAVRAFDQSQDLPLYIVNSTFERNSCSNGGAVGSIGVSFTILNSLFVDNDAIGWGANRAKDPSSPGGGNGGAIYNDGGLYHLEVCGIDVHDNVGNAGGGGIFYVSNDLTGTLTIKDSSLVNNLSKEFETKGFPGIFYLGNGPIKVENSVLE